MYICLYAFMYVFECMCMFMCDEGVVVKDNEKYDLFQTNNDYYGSTRLRNSRYGYEKKDSRLKRTVNLSKGFTPVRLSGTRSYTNRLWVTHVLRIGLLSLWCLHRRRIYWNLPGVPDLRLPYDSLV